MSNDLFSYCPTTTISSGLKRIEKSNKQGSINMGVAALALVVLVHSASCTSYLINFGEIKTPFNVFSSFNDSNNPQYNHPFPSH